jgi:hypothetical protein
LRWEEKIDAPAGGDAISRIEPGKGLTSKLWDEVDLANMPREPGQAYAGRCEYFDVVAQLTQSGRHLPRCEA